MDPSPDPADSPTSATPTGEVVPASPVKPPPEAKSFGWTLRQRKSLLTLLLILTAFLVYRYATAPAYVSNPQPERAARFAELADRIDPNTADVASLAALPTLGKKRADAIVDFRTARTATRPTEPAFRRAEDLFRIPGIGAATLEALRPFLIFPTTQPTPSPP